MRILIVGAGDIGFQLSKRLSQDKHDITVVERNPKRAKWADDQLDVLAVEGSGASYEVLSRANLHGMDVVAGMSNNDEVNLLACRLAKKVGVGATIARVRNPEFTSPDFILTPEELGVDLVIHPEKETAEAVARLIRQSKATYVIEFEEGKIELLGVYLEENSPLVRIPLIDLWSRFDHPPVTIAAIQRKQHTVIPRGRDVMVPGDQVFAICDPAYTAEFIALTGQQDARIENIMILGGGLIGQYVAADLGKEVRAKVIESSVEKSWEIADRLSESLIIQGDGTDFDLLASEGIMEMDAFVAVTGDDETNIISTLLARHLRVPRTIALVNNVNYLPITATIGMDAVVSKQLLTVNAVQRFIQQQQVASIASLPGVDAQCVEYIAGEGSRITRKSIQDIRFPKHAIVGGVMHDGKLVTPRGPTRIQPGDRAVVFALPQAVAEVEKLFRS